MPIARNQLAPGEEVIIDVRPHWQVLVGPAVLPVMVVGGAIAITAIVHPSQAAFKIGLLALSAAIVLRFAMVVLRWTRTSLVITTERLVLQSGVLARKNTQVRLQRIIEVTCTQRVLDRILGTGRLTIGLLDGDPIELGDVRRPAGIQKILYRQIRSLDGAGTPQADTTSDTVDDFEPGHLDHDSEDDGGRVPMLGTFDEPLAPPAEVIPPPLPTARPYDDAAFTQDQQNVVAPFDATPPRGTSAVIEGSSTARLEELAELYRKGLISASEYEHLRGEVLARYAREG